MKWENSVILTVLSFWLVEFWLKFLAEIYSPDFPIIDFNPYIKIAATHYRNPNSCLGILKGFSGTIKFLVTAVAAVCLFGFTAYCHFRPVGVNVKRAVAFLVAGAVGNLVDRMTLGVVVDYVNVQLGESGEYLYLAWNLSDLAINFGILFLFYADFKRECPFDGNSGSEETALQKSKVDGKLD
jgi:signal peptidase II